MKRCMTALLTLVFCLGLIPFLGIPGLAAQTILNEEVPLMLWYDEEAPYGGEKTPQGLVAQRNNNPNDGWERWSLPLGNGYFGANVFGRTATERIQLTEKTLCNEHASSEDSAGGLNNFSETYLDFGHTFSDVTNYQRSLDLRTAISSVSYTYGGVAYEREYFTSYEDYCMVIKLTADKAGALDFELRPTIPYIQDYASSKALGSSQNNKTYMNATKHGKVTASVTSGENIIHLYGHMGAFGIDFEAQYRVFTDGDVSVGSYTETYASNVVANANDPYNSGVRDVQKQTITVESGTLKIEGAKEAYIVITLGTNYDQSKGADNSSIYTTSNVADKLKEAGVDAKAANDARMDAALAASFNKASSLSAGYKLLRDRHLNDYQELFDRVSFTLEIDPADLDRTTDTLLSRYKSNQGNGHYLEMLYYQYGRYLMIASSREKSLPSNLQGTWNRYNYAPWGAGYWHNINEQMNYWPVFSANLAECFEGYINMQQAYMAQAKNNAKNVLKSSPYNYSGSEAGFTIGTGVTPYVIGSTTQAGNIGFTTQLFWEYYQYTQDKELLRDTVYPILYEAAQFITKTVKYNESEDAYLTVYCDSPEQYVNGVWYHTEGTTYAQSFAYLNNLHLLKAADILGLEDDALLTEVRRQLDKYDAILVGYSGQVKEFREEDYYGDLGEYTHRHISQLVGLFPGEMINSNTQAWLDAATVTLTERGDQATGWGVAHRLNLWSHTKQGDRTYLLVQQLLKSNTATNLWDLHTPFQIDGNFGGLSGMTEMLLQSHEGYIDPLAACPSAWSTGSFKGLVARGGFIVDAAWNDGSITSLTVTSQVGGSCSIEVQGINSATIRDSKGNTIKTTKDGANRITFDTVAGESYTVKNLQKQVTVAPASHLSVTRLTANHVALAWEKSDDAHTYRVYKAEGDAPSYTLVAETKNLNTVCTVTPSEQNARMTYRVTAVDAAGRESVGTLAYLIPSDTALSSVQATVLSDGTLQVLAVTQTPADQYTLYEFNEDLGAWEHALTSEYPVLLYRDYDAKRRYAVSATTAFAEGRREELTEITSVGNSAGSVEDPSINVFEGLPASSIEYSSKDNLTIHQLYPIANGFDGDTSTRWAVSDRRNSPFSVTITLPDVYKLKTLRIYDFRNPSETESRSDKTKVEVFYDGVWMTVVQSAALDRVSDQGYAEFNLDFSKAQKVRFTFENSKNALSATIYEITCTAAKSSPVDRSALLHTIQEADALDLTFADAAYRMRYMRGVDTARQVLSGSHTTQAAIDAQVKSLRALMDACPKVGDADLSITESILDGSQSVASLPTVGGIGGKVQNDLAYKLADVKTYTILSDLAKTDANKNYTLELNALVGGKASLTLMSRCAITASSSLGTASTSGTPQLILNGSTMSIKNAKLTAINGKPVPDGGTTLCTMQTDEWYKLAISMYFTAGESAVYFDITVNGTTYTVLADKPLYGIYAWSFSKASTGSAYIDNICVRTGDDAVYYAKRDVPNTISPDVSAPLTLSGRELRTAGRITVAQLKALTTQDLRVFSDGTMTTLLSDSTTLSGGETVVTFSKGGRSYERTYAYYTVSVPSEGHTTHTPDATWQKNDTHHWQECTSCGGQRINKATHVYDGDCDPECNTCGALRDELVHDFTHGYYGAPEGHRAQCACGVANDTVLPHTSGGAATETDDEVCTVCGYVITPATGPLVHEPTETWEKNDTHHWRECSVCDEAHLSYEEHNFDDWIIVKEATETEEGARRRICRTCKYRQDEVIPVFDPNAPTTPTDPPKGGCAGCAGSVGDAFISILSALALVLFRKKIF